MRIRAKTVEEALQQCVARTGWARDDVIVTVLNEKRGLFGPKWVEVELHLREAPVAATAAEVEEKETEPVAEVEVKERDGRLSFVGGRLQYEEPLGRGRYPTIKVGKGVRLKANGEPVTVFPFVYDGQQEVVVEAVSEPSERRLDVMVSEDGLQAKMRVEYINGYTAVLQDYPEMRVALTLRAKLEETEPPRYSMDELKAALKQKGVVFGIQEDKLERLAQEGSLDWVVVAEGIPAQDGIDGRIELIFHNDDWGMLNPMESQFRKQWMRDIESVEEGQLVARLYPPLPGKDGTTVTGQPIPHKPGKEIQMVAGKGIRLNEAGTEAIAEVSGRPILNRNVVSILPVHVVNGDLSFKEGGIRFKGDVAVHGSVLDGVELEAVGNIYLYGNVNNARVAAQGNIVAEKTVFGGRLVAGVVAEDVLQVEQLLRDIEENFTNLRIGIEQLRRQRDDLGQQPIGKLAFLLLENKFRHLPRLVEQFHDLIRNNPLLQEWSSGLENEMLHHVQRPVLLGNAELDYEHLVEEIRDRLAVLEDVEERKGSVTARSLNNTVVEASGDVKVKESVYYSQIYARGSVHCQGFVRASEIYADGDVECTEVGTRSGTRAVVVTNGVFRAKKVYPNVEVTASGERELFNREALDVVIPRSFKEE